MNVQTLSEVDWRFKAYRVLRDTVETVYDRRVDREVVVTIAGGSKHPRLLVAHDSGKTAAAPIAGFVDLICTDLGHFGHGEAIAGLDQTVKELFKKVGAKVETAHEWRQ